MMDLLLLYWGNGDKEDLLLAASYQCTIIINNYFTLRKSTAPWGAE